MAKFNTEYDYLIHLLKSVLDGTQPEEKPENLNFDNLLSAAKKHSVANMAFYAVERLKKGPDEDLRKKWAEIRDKAIVKELIQQHEFNKITDAFRKENIRCLAFKGIFLKDLYPQRDMRVMSDIDVFVDENNVGKVKEIMLSQGYEPDETPEMDHDSYFKKPVMNIEVHRQIFGEKGEEYIELFSDPWLHTEEVKPFLWNFDVNWFFIYILAHLERHYSHSGTGIRSVMDIYVYIKAKEKQLDWDYIYSVLNTVGKDQFCRDIIEIANIWFGEKEASPKYEKMANYMLGSGTYGTTSNYHMNNRSRMGAAKFLLDRLFPPLYIMQSVFPFLKKAPFLYPLMWPVRWVYRGIFRKNQIKDQIKILRDNK